MNQTWVTGNFIGGAWHAGTGLVRSVNPYRLDETVYETSSDLKHVDLACQSAQDATKAWSMKSVHERYAMLLLWKKEIEAEAEAMARMIMRETGKTLVESKQEVTTVLARFELAKKQYDELKEGTLPGFPNEALLYHPHGVVAVVGPFNFPLHLCNAHILPALILGNTVVMKPSDLTPGAAMLYIKAAERVLPPGVINLLQGDGRVGEALILHPLVRGLAFTGSWHVGRIILEKTLDKPETLLALEMGGKNTAIVCEDADIRQAVHEIVMGGYLTTGQRCTCTDRVLVHKSKVKPLVEGLLPVIRSLQFGDPENPKSFAGPLASARGLERFVSALGAAKSAGAKALLNGVGDGSKNALRTASLHLLEEGQHHVTGYTDTELFGPDLGIEVFGSDEEAISVMNASPYVFANSVFTASEARFTRYYQETRSGLLNRNRSTNQASPRLPFGGTGRSGNFRPAGSFAIRNLGVPVAVQKNEVAVMPTHAALVGHLPEVDFDALWDRHQAESTPFPRMKHKKTVTPDVLAESTAWMERLYAADRMVREKKPYVIDHARSSGAYLATIDEPPFVFLDSMSQTATMPFGFAAEPLVDAYEKGVFAETMLHNHDTTGADSEPAQAYANTLKKLFPMFKSVSFVACGAEANEKAYAMCLEQHKRWDTKPKLLAFEGSFHGRTLLSLYGSHNPSKRVAYEIKGYEAVYVPYPVIADEQDLSLNEGQDEVLKTVAKLDWNALHSWSKGNAQKESEVASLKAVHDAIVNGNIFAVVIEPMQSEGGDRYASAQYHRALRVLTRALNVPLIMDEVQCGFGLGGALAWHSQFKLQHPDGTPDHPDCFLIAKRAQVGVVMSVFDDPESAPSFAASLVRGRLHVEHHDPKEASRVERMLRDRMPTLQQRWGHRIKNIRARGFAFAFDMENPAEAMRYLGQRYYRGSVAFIAGDKTIRYRLNTAYGEQEIEQLFHVIYQSLAHIEADAMDVSWKGIKSPEHPPEVKHILSGQNITEAQKDVWVKAIMNLEASIFEPARRDSKETIEKAFQEGGIAITHWRSTLDDTPSSELMGYALAAPLERFENTDGPKDDAHMGKNDSVYSIALSVNPKAQGTGLGKQLKEMQLRLAMDMKAGDGKPRYTRLTGRNRVGLADQMGAVNELFAAKTLQVYENQYGEDASSRYYEQRFHHTAPLPHASETMDLSAGLMRPFSKPLDSLVQMEQSGRLWGPTVNKLTLLNHVTKDAIAAIETIGHLAPEQPHLYLTSGRDETADKSVRILKHRKPTGSTLLSFEGAYLGHTTACARGLGDPKVRHTKAEYFDFLRAVYPETEADLGAIRVLVNQHKEALFGIYIEPVQERGGHLLSSGMAKGLREIADGAKLPLVFVETASSYYRTGRVFGSSDLGVEPDMRIWWTGGQLGVIHVATPYFVGTPLTFVSTWDGDELSLIQAHHQLHAARKCCQQDSIQKHIATLDAFQAKHPTLIRGKGLYRLVHPSLPFGGRTLPNGLQVFAPAYDQLEPAVQKLSFALNT